MLLFAFAVPAIIETIATAVATTIAVRAASDLYDKIKSSDDEEN